MKIKHFMKLFCCFILIFLVALSSSSLALEVPKNIIEENITTIKNSTEKQNNVPNKNEINNEIIASYETDYKFSNSDKFYFDSNVEISEIIDGNVFVYGNTVNVTGEIYGDLFIAGNNLNISKNSVIHGNIFAFGGTLEVSGICSDIYAYVSDFKLNSSAIIARNVNLLSNTVVLSGQINKDANINSQNISFEATNNSNLVDKESNVASNNKQKTSDKEVNNNIIIKGNLNYTSQNEQNIPENIVGGKITYNKPEIKTTGVIISIVKNTISGLIFSFALIMLLLWISPNFKDKASTIIKKDSFKTFGIGLLVFFGTILAVIILLLFSAGLATSLAVATAILLALAYIISNTIFSMSIGKLIANKLNLNKNIAFVLLSLLIVLVLSLIKYIPYIGFPINFITSMIGLGIIAINSFKRKEVSLAN